jgi:hypothetical protein
MFDGLADKYQVKTFEKGKAKEEVVSQASIDFLKKIDVKEAKFSKAYIRAFNTIKKTNNRGHYLNKLVHMHMVTMSGLPWGISSHHKNCNWGRVISGLVAEAFLVWTYGKKLLDACASAHALCVHLHGIFLKCIDYIVDEKAPSGSGYSILKVGEVVDKIDIGKIEANIDIVDIQALQTD